MKNTKLKLVIVAITSIFFSCNRTDFSKPEDVIKNYKILSRENKNDVLYDDYLSSKSKEIVTKDEYIKKRNKPDSVLKKMKGFVTNISSYPADINNPSYRRFKVEDKYFEKSDTNYSTYYYTLCNENGKWKIIWTDIHFSFAEEKYNNGNYSEAHKTLDKIIEINPFDGKAYELIAWCYLRDNSISRAEMENGVAKNAKYAVSLEEDNPKH